MQIDCDECVMQHTEACGDCIVTVLLGNPGFVELGNDESLALGHLAEAGMVAPLRLVRRPAGDEPSSGGSATGDAASA